MSMRKEERCLCGQQYGTETEQRNGWCLQCEKQRVLCEEKMTQLVHAYQAALPLVHMIRKAIEAEGKARALSAQETPSGEPTFSYAYTQCSILHSITEAFTQWAYVSTRLWLLQEQEKKGETKAILVVLHQWGVEQFQRLFTIHLVNQQEVLQFCQEHHIFPRVAQRGDEAGR